MSPRRGPTPQSGLTLVEVLAALVLLTLVATTSLGFVRRARQALAEEPSAVGGAELAEVADGLLANPIAFGLARLPEEGSVPWPNRPDRPSLQLRLLRAREPDVRHAWLVIECGPARVLRWIPEPPEPGE